MMFARVTLGILAGLASLASSAAALEYSHADNNGVRFLIVSGPFGLSEDLSRFATALQASGARLVTFDSPGGSTQSAMQLGRMIRALGLLTYQERRMDCASACSLAFLGGVTRYADPGSIGVHRSSFSPDVPYSRDQAVSEVQQGTADIMAYLREMGVDSGLLEFALRYDQTDIRYLSASEMRALNVINYEPSNEHQPPQVPTPSPQQSQPAPSESFETAALSFVKQLVEQHGNNPQQALSDVLSYYDTSISYYGKQTALTDVIADKQRYFQRWPERAYRIRDDSVMVTCANNSCMVTGIYDWIVRSLTRNKQAKGQARFSYTISLGQRPKVVAEAGEILGR